MILSIQMRNQFEGKHKVIFREPSRKRSAQLGRFPLEALPKDLHILKQEAERPQILEPDAPGSSPTLLSIAAQQYFDLFMEYRKGKVAPARAPVPDDLERRRSQLSNPKLCLTNSQITSARLLNFLSEHPGRL